MSHSATVWPPHAGLIGAASSRNRGSLPRVCLPPGHHSRTLPSPSPCGPRIPPSVRVLTPLPASVEHKYPPDHLTIVLPNRHRLS
jgi:hypothetical protein